ncbi:MAG: HEAT repeat domain-containing protein [Candidatus Omnitrophica bacterium]|nr:HEAT repeat domain-containing protein [Candidatus Omnitrophota bacterium]
MNKEGQTVAALITGGYHTKGISELLKQKETSYLVILPKFDASKPERPYVAILTNKKDNYEELLESGKYQLLTDNYLKDGIQDPKKIEGFIKEIVVVSIGQAAIERKDIASVKKLWIESYKRAYEASASLRKEEEIPSTVITGNAKDTADNRAGNRVGNLRGCTGDDGLGDQHIATTTNFPATGEFNVENIARVIEYIDARSKGATKSVVKYTGLDGSTQYYFVEELRDSFSGVVTTRVTPTVASEFPGQQKLQAASIVAAPVGAPATVAPTPVPSADIKESLIKAVLTRLETLNGDAENNIGRVCNAVIPQEYKIYQDDIKTEVISRLKVSKQSQPLEPRKVEPVAETPKAAAPEIAKPTTLPKPAVSAEQRIPASADRSELPAPANIPTTPAADSRAVPSESVTKKVETGQAGLSISSLLRSFKNHVIRTMPDIKEISWNAIPEQNRLWIITALEVAGIVTVFVALHAFGVINLNCPSIVSEVLVKLASVDIRDVHKWLMGPGAPALLVSIALLAAFFKTQRFAQGDTDTVPRYIDGNATARIRPSSFVAAKQRSIIGLAWKAVDDEIKESLSEQGETSQDYLTVERERNTYFTLGALLKPEYKIFLTVRNESPYKTRMLQIMNRIAQLLHEEGISADVSVTKRDEFESITEICVNVNVNIGNLRRIWLALGTGDFKFDEETANYRELTKDEIIAKLEERVGTYLYAMPPGSAERKNLETYFYGDGTQKNVGLINIVKDPAKYGDLQAIKIESYDDPDRLKNACSYNDLEKVAGANPFFAEFVRRQNADRYVFLARAAGSCFQTFSIGNLFEGNPDRGNIFFISKDTVGESFARIMNHTINSMVERYSEDNLETPTYEWLEDAVVNYFLDTIYMGECEIIARDKVTGAKHTLGISRVRDVMARRMSDGTKIEYFTVLSPHDRSTEIGKVCMKDGVPVSATATGKIKDTINAAKMDITVEDINNYLPIAELLNAIYRQYETSGILDNLQPNSTLCVVDEFADGSFDFVTKYIIEKKTVNTPRPIKVKIFIGATRSWRVSSMPDYPTLKEKDISAVFGISTQEAKEIIDNVSKVADFVPHPIMVPPQKKPVLSSDMQLQFENEEVVIGAYLKSLLIYNAVVAFHNKYNRKDTLIGDKILIPTGEQVAIGAAPASLPFMVEQRPSAQRYMTPDIIMAVHEILASNVFYNKFKEFGVTRETVQKVTIDEVRTAGHPRAPWGRDVLTLSIYTPDGVRQFSVVLYRRGYNLDPSISNSYECVASRFFYLYRDMRLENYDSELKKCGIDYHDIINEIEPRLRRIFKEYKDRLTWSDFLNIDYVRQQGVGAVYAYLVKRNIPPDIIEKAFAIVGFSETKTEYQKSQCVLTPYLPANILYMDTDDHVYFGCKVRILSGNPTAQEVLINQSYKGEDLSVKPAILSAIKKEIVKKLLYYHNHDQLVYNAIAEKFMLDRNVRADDVQRLNRELSKLNGVELDNDRKNFLSNICGITEFNANIGEMLVASFSELHTARRYPFDITLNDFIVRKGNAESPDAVFVDLTAQGGYVRFTRDNELVRHINERLGISYDIIFSVVQEFDRNGTYSALRFCQNIIADEVEETPLKAYAIRAMSSMPSQVQSTIDNTRNDLTKPLPDPLITKPEAMGANEPEKPSKGPSIFSVLPLFALSSDHMAAGIVCSIAFTIAMLIWQRIRDARDKKYARISTSIAESIKELKKRTWDNFKTVSFELRKIGVPAIPKLVEVAVHDMRESNREKAIVILRRIIKERYMAGKVARVELKAWTQAGNRIYARENAAVAMEKLGLGKAATVPFSLPSLFFNRFVSLIPIAFIVTLATGCAQTAPHGPVVSTGNYAITLAFTALLLFGVVRAGIMLWREWSRPKVAVEAKNPVLFLEKPAAPAVVAVNAAAPSNSPQSTEDKIQEVIAKILAIPDINEESAEARKFLEGFAASMPHEHRTQADFGRIYDQMLTAYRHYKSLQDDAGFGLEIFNPRDQSGKLVGHTDIMLVIKNAKGLVPIVTKAVEDVGAWVSMWHYKYGDAIVMVIEACRADAAGAPVIDTPIPEDGIESLRKNLLGIDINAVENKEAVIEGAGSSRQEIVFGITDELHTIHGMDIYMTSVVLPSDKPHVRELKIEKEIGYFLSVMEKIPDNIAPSEIIKRLTDDTISLIRKRWKRCELSFDAVFAKAMDELPDQTEFLNKIADAAEKIMNDREQLSPEDIPAELELFRNARRKVEQELANIIASFRNRGEEEYAERFEIITYGFEGKGGIINEFKGIENQIKGVAGAEGERCVRAASIIYKKAAIMRLSAEKAIAKGNAHFASAQNDGYNVYNNMLIHLHGIHSLDVGRPAPEVLAQRVTSAQTRLKEALIQIRQEMDSGNRYYFKPFVQDLEETAVHLIASQKITAVSAVYELAELEESNINQRSEIPPAEKESMKFGVRYTATRIAEIIEGAYVGDVSCDGDSIVLICDSIDPAKVWRIKRNRPDVKVLVTPVGSSTAHVTVAARQAGFIIIPGAHVKDAEGFVLATKRLEANRPVIVDAANGLVIQDPSERTMAGYARVSKRLKEREAFYKTRAASPARTKDTAAELTVLADVANLGQIEAARQNGAFGTGLYRLEWLYDAAQRPTEEEMEKLFNTASDAMKPGEPLTIRLIDMRMDKKPMTLEATRLGGCEYYFNESPENEGRKVVREELRAIMKAYASSDKKNLEILFPMVSAAYIPRIDALIKGVKQELIAEGVPAKEIEGIKIGGMFETPDAAAQAAELFDYFDFMKVGMNDFYTESLPGADRDLPEFEKYFSTLNPTVLGRLIYIAEQAKAKGKDLGFCGEPASNPRFAFFVMRLKEIHPRISVTSNMGVIPRLKEMIRHTTVKECFELFKDVQPVTDPAMLPDMSDALDLAVRDFERLIESRALRAIEFKRFSKEYRARHNMMAASIRLIGDWWDAHIKPRTGIGYDPFVVAPRVEEAIKVGVPLTALSLLNTFNHNMPVLNAGIFIGLLVAAGVAFVFAHALDVRAPPGLEGRNIFSRTFLTIKSLSKENRHDLFWAPRRVALQGGFMALLVLPFIGLPAFLPFIAGIMAMLSISYHRRINRYVESEQAKGKNLGFSTMKKAGGREKEPVIARPEFSDPTWRAVCEKLYTMINERLPKNDAELKDWVEDTQRDLDAQPFPSKDAVNLDKDLSRMVKSVGGLTRIKVWLGYERTMRVGVSNVMFKYGHIGTQEAADREAERFIENRHYGDLQILNDYCDQSDIMFSSEIADRVEGALEEKGKVDEQLTPFGLHHIQYERMEYFRVNDPQIFEIMRSETYNNLITVIGWIADNNGSRSKYEMISNNRVAANRLDWLLRNDREEFKRALADLTANQLPEVRSVMDEFRKTPYGKIILREFDIRTPASISELAFHGMGPHEVAQALSDEKKTPEELAAAKIKRARFNGHKKIIASAAKHTARPGQALLELTAATAALAAIVAYALGYTPAFVTLLAASVFTLLAAYILHIIQIGIFTATELWKIESSIPRPPPAKFIYDEIRNIEREAATLILKAQFFAGHKNLSQIALSALDEAACIYAGISDSFIPDDIMLAIAVTASEILFYMQEDVHEKVLSEFDNHPSLVIMRSFYTQEIRNAFDEHVETVSAKVRQSVSPAYHSGFWSWLTTIIKKTISRPGSGVMMISLAGISTTALVATMGTASIGITFTEYFMPVVKNASPAPLGDMILEQVAPIISQAALLIISPLVLLFTVPMDFVKRLVQKLAITRNVLKKIVFTIAGAGLLTVLMGAAAPEAYLNNTGTMWLGNTAFMLGFALAAVLAFPSGAGKISALIRALKSQDRRTRWESVIALSEMGPPAKAAVPALAKALRDHDADVRHGAATALTNKGPAAISVLAEALEDTDAGVRREVAIALGNIGAPAKVAVPTLVKTLRDPYSYVRREAVIALGKIGPSAKAAIPVLAEALRHHDINVRREAVIALGEMGPPAEAAVPALTKALEDPDEDVSRKAVIALGKMGPSAKAAIPALAKALRGYDINIRQEAAIALVKIDPAAISIFIAALEDANAGGWYEATIAIGEMDSPAKAGASYAYVGLEAAIVLGMMGPSAKAAVPALTKALKHHDINVRREAVIALGKIGADAKAAVPALTKALDDPDINVCREATIALVKIGDDAVSILINILEYSATDSRIMTIVAVLGEMGPSAKAAVPALVRILKKSQSIIVSCKVVEVLAEIGHGVSAAVSALKEALDNENLIVRVMARVALNKINFNVQDLSGVADESLFMACERGPDPETLKPYLFVPVSRLKIADKSLFNAEVKAGRIVKRGNRYYFVFKNPLYKYDLPISLDEEPINNRSLVFYSEAGDVIYKGEGASHPFYRKDGSGIKRLMNIKLGETPHILYGGLPASEASMDKDGLLRKEFEELKNTGDPVYTAAAQYGIDIGMFRAPIAMARPTHLPAYEMESNGQAKLSFIPIKRFLKIAGIPLKHEEENDPVIYIYRVFSNRRMLELNKTNTLKHVFGNKIPSEEDKKKILLSFAARCALFIYIVHKKLNGTCHNKYGSVFSGHNCNWQTFFDYDTIMLESKEDNDGSVLYADISDAKIQICRFADMLGINHESAYKVFTEVFTAKSVKSKTVSEARHPRVAAGPMFMGFILVTMFPRLAMWINLAWSAVKGFIFGTGTTSVISLPTGIPTKITEDLTRVSRAIENTRLEAEKIFGVNAPAIPTKITVGIPPSAITARKAAIETILSSAGGKYEVVTVDNIAVFADESADRGTARIFIDNDISGEAIKEHILLAKLATNYSGVLATANIDRALVKEITDLIKDILGDDAMSLNAAEIFLRVGEAVKDSVKKEKIARLAGLVALQQNAVAGQSQYTQDELYKGMNAPHIINKSVIHSTTEEVAVQDRSYGRNLNKTESLGVTNVFIHGDIFKDEAQAKRFLVESGYNGNFDNIRFVSKTGKTYEEIIKEVKSKAPNAVNIGIRTAKGEFKDIDSSLAVTLEIQPITINGRNILMTMDTYEVLLKILKLTEGAPIESVALDSILPGVIFDSRTGMFRYLPKTLPINYGEELETYRAAILVLAAAA